MISSEIHHFSPFFIGNLCCVAPFLNSIGWFKGKITGNSHISWENLWFPVDFPLSQPIENSFNNNNDTKDYSNYPPTLERKGKHNPKNSVTYCTVNPTI